MAVLSRVKVDILSLPLQRNDRMEGQRLGIVVYPHISIVSGDDPADAFQPETMIMAGGWYHDRRITVFPCEGICPAGVDDCQNGKRRFFFSSCADLNKCFRNVFGRFHGIVEQIAE